MPTGLLLTLASASASFVPSSEDPVRASLPIRIERNLVSLPVSVAGSAPFHVVLDTGMPTRGVVLYGSERVEALGLDFADAEEVSGAGGSHASIRARVAAGAELELGGLELAGVPVIVLPLPPGFPPAHEGIIGSELFERFAVRIDYEAARLTLLDPEGLQVPEGGTTVPLHFRGGGPFLDARVAVAGEELLPAELAVDLGASHALWMNSSREARFAPPQGSIEARLGRGLSGPVEGRVGRVRRIEIGEVALQGVVAVFPRVGHQHPGGFDFRDGFVGGETLRRFRVTFDYRGSRMILEPGPRVGEPFEYDMTGLHLDPSDPDRRVIEAVIPGSPASDAGLLPGDVLTEIDGKGVGTLGPDELMRALRVEGAELRLRLERGGEILERRIRLRRLV